MEDNGIAVERTAYGLNREVVFSGEAPYGIQMPPTSDILSLFAQIKDGTVSIEGIEPEKMPYELADNATFRQIKKAEDRAVLAGSNSKFITDEAVSSVEFDAADVLHMIANHGYTGRTMLLREFVTTRADKLIYGMSIKFDYDEPRTMKLPFYMSFITSARGSYYDLYIALRQEGTKVSEFIALLSLAGHMEFDSLSDFSAERIMPTFYALGDTVADGTRMQWLWIASSWASLAKKSYNDVLENEDFFYVARNSRPELALEILKLGGDFTFLRSALEDDLDSNVMRAMLLGDAA